MLKRRDLKIVVMSATLDALKFQQYFDNAPLMKVGYKHFFRLITHHLNHYILFRSYSSSWFFPPLLHLLFFITLSLRFTLPMMTFTHHTKLIKLVVAKTPKTFGWHILTQRFLVEPTRLKFFILQNQREIMWKQRWGQLCLFISVRARYVSHHLFLLIFLVFVLDFNFITTSALDEWSRIVTSHILFSNVFPSWGNSWWEVWHHVIVHRSSNCVLFHEWQLCSYQIIWYNIIYYDII